MIPPIDPTDDCCVEGMASERFAAPQPTSGCDCDANGDVPGVWHALSCPSFRPLLQAAANTPIVTDDTDLLGTIADLRDQVRAQDQLIVGLTEELAETKAALWDAQWVPA